MSLVSVEYETSDWNGFWLALGSNLLISHVHDVVDDDEKVKVKEKKKVLTVNLQVDFEFQHPPKVEEAIEKKQF